MGIKNFSKLFAPTKAVQFKDMKGQTIAIDAAFELYRASLGAKTVRELTDRNGNPTLFLNVILMNVIEMQRQGINAIWIFDNPKQGHVAEKDAEHEKRKIRKDNAYAKLEKLDAYANTTTTQTNTTTAQDAARPKRKEICIVDDDGNVIQGDKTVSRNQVAPEQKDVKITDYIDYDSLVEESYAMSAAATDAKRNGLEKQTFGINSSMVEDVKKLFDSLNIRYIIAPEGIEGEHLAAYMASPNIDPRSPFRVDAAYSGDADPIPFGASILYRKNIFDKKIYKYEREDIIRQITKGVNQIDAAAEAKKLEKGKTKKLEKDKTKIKLDVFDNTNYYSATHDDLVSICVMMGSDFSEKTPRLGCKNILSKFRNTKLTAKQTLAYNLFKKIPPTDSLVVYNLGKIPFGKNANYKGLINWLFTEKQFDRQRIVKHLLKVVSPDLLA